MASDTKAIDEPTTPVGRIVRATGAESPGPPGANVDMDSPDTWQWIWLVAAVALAMGELVVPGTFFMVSFAFGAAVAALASFLGASVLVSWLCFVAGTALGLGILVPVGRRMNRELGDQPVGATRLLGQRAVVLQEIPAGPHATGIVRVEREEWRAEHAAGTAVAPGTEVEILGVNGTRVVVQLRHAADEEVC